MDERLQDLTPKMSFRANVAAILLELRERGYRPVMKETIRTEAQQRKKVEDGHSKTMHSFHRVGDDGLGRAADIVDKTLLWKESANRYWLALGHASFKRGVGWGGVFARKSDKDGYPPAAMLELIELGEKADEESWPAGEAHALYRRVRALRSWDPGHVQIFNNWAARAYLEEVVSGRVEEPAEVESISLDELRRRAKKKRAPRKPPRR